MIELRDYQNKMIEETRQKLRKVKNVLLQAPTGAGKTVLTAKMLHSAQSKNNTSFFIVHRQELVDQAAKTFDKVGVEYGIIAAGYTRNPLPKIQICMVQTLINKLRVVRKPHLIILDEAHHSRSTTWQTIIDYFSAAKCVGLTATPKRLDGKGLGDIFEDIVLGPQVSWLIENGFLANYKIFAPNTPDMSRIHTVGGDYNKKEVAELMDNSKIIGDAVAHYAKICAGKSTLVFCSSIKHSLHTVEQFRAAGFDAKHIDGTTDKDERRQMLDDFRNKKFPILCNVDLIGEGVDIVGAEVAILLNPTKSLTKYMQQVGRVLRYEKGKLAYILDHAGNVFRHGLPDEERNWELTYTKEKKQKSTDIVEKIIMCENCYCVYSPTLPACPSCGTVREIKSRIIEEEVGELVEIDRSLIKQNRLKEQSSARTLEELLAYAKSKGYKEGWAHRIYAIRQQKQQQNAEANT